MQTICKRLHRGDDLLESIRHLAAEHQIAAGVILSAVGCISKGRVRDASGVTIRDIPDHCEIVSLNGTVSAQRCHLHTALSKEDLFFAVWGRDSADTLKVVANTVSNLRRKMGGSHTYIRTVRGGYVFSAVSATA